LRSLSRRGKKSPDPTVPAFRLSGSQYSAASSLLLQSPEKLTEATDILLYPPRGFGVFRMEQCRDVEEF